MISASGMEAKAPRWTRALLWVLQRHVARRREPDRKIGGDDDVYLERWFIIPKNRWFNIYLHHFRRSDDDRALHDHPWANASLLLDGDYYEWRPWSGRKPRDGELMEEKPDGQHLVRYHRRAGALYLRRPTQAHRVELINERPIWTLFVTASEVREWGFLCPKGWTPWQEFTDPTSNGNRIGRGCG